MSIDLTPLIRPMFVSGVRRTDKWSSASDEIQQKVLAGLIRRGASAEFGRSHGFGEFREGDNPRRFLAERVETREYEDIRADVMRMIGGERDVLWPGRCMNYAQSSGTSGGRSKFIPVTRDSLYRCHYPGAADSVAHYLRSNPRSRMFSGKGMILGGSFAHTLKVDDPRVRIGDLSATLISRISPAANIFRIPDKKTALIPDWREKLPELVEKGSKANVTNISGVPSWFLTVIKEIVRKNGVEKISDVWPNLEVFFHGGINFAPYREEYARLTNPDKMHFVDTYNASEGFFASQHNPDSSDMLLIIDNDIFYEFVDIDCPGSAPVALWEVEKGKVYEMLITSSNGLWRYRLGDTVRICSTSPVTVRVAGRTKTFINAFGEELMEENAERAIADVSSRHNAAIRNFTAGPLFAEGNRKGRHQWVVEWEKRPSDEKRFAADLDGRLRELNSDYDAKRTGNIFLDPLELISVADGTFNRWLRSVGTGKLGGQRKVPRLSNDRTILTPLLQFARE